MLFRVPRRALVVVVVALAMLATSMRPPQRADAAGADDVPTLSWMQVLPGGAGADNSSIVEDVALSSDGATIYDLSEDRSTIVEIDADSGIPTGKISVDMQDPVAIAASANGLYVLSCEGVTPTRCAYALWTVDPSSGAATRLASMSTTKGGIEEPDRKPLVISADGKWAYVMTSNSLYVVHLVDHAVRTLPANGAANVGSAPGGGEEWIERGTLDNQGVLHAHLELIDPSTGASSTTVTLPPGTVAVRPMPDQQHLLVLSRVDTPEDGAGTDVSILSIAGATTSTIGHLPATDTGRAHVALSADGAWGYVLTSSGLFAIELGTGAISDVLSSVPDAGDVLQGLDSFTPDTTDGFFAVNLLPSSSTPAVGLFHFAPAASGSLSALTASTGATLSGAAVLATATVTPPNWSVSPDSVSYQWYSGARQIPGATAATLTVTPDLADKPLFAVVTASASGFAADSIATALLLPIPASLATQVPTVVGAAAVGSTLTAHPGAWTEGTTFSYQWNAGGAAIPRATASSFVVTSAQEGKSITVTVTGQLHGYASASTRSAATAKVPIVPYKPKVPAPLAGADRWGTAIAVSKDSYPTSGVAKTVVVTSGENFPDALSAAPAAVKLGGPLLLTPHDRLPSAVAAEVKRLAPKRIVIVGGTTAVSAGVMSSLAKIAPTTRVWGADRFATSLAIAKFAFGSTNVPSVFFATGATFVDALSGGAFAGAKGMPVVLVPASGSALPAQTAAWLKSAHTVDPYAAGGSDVFSYDMVGAIQAATGENGISDNAGTDRYDTNRIINHRDGTYAGVTTAFVASGSNFPDALAGAAAAGKAGEPLYLAESTCVPAATITAMSSAGIGTVKLLGGTSALGAGVRKMIPCSS